MYCNVCNKYKRLKYHIFLSASIVYSKCDCEYETIFKEKEAIELLKILGSVNDIEKYQKICNHAWRKHYPRM